MLIPTVTEIRRHGTGQADGRAPASAGSDTAARRLVRVDAPAAPQPSGPAAGSLPRAA
jgi:hypothetical protein